MGWTKKVLLLLVLLCGLNIEAQITVLKPDKVFGLYFDTFVKHDNKALTTLNQYLKNFMGAEAIYNTDRNETYEQEVTGFTNLFLSEFSESVGNECRQQVRDYFVALFDRFKTATYSIKNMETMRNDYSQSQDVSEVYYEVKIKIPSEESAFVLKDSKNITAKQLKSYLKDLTHKLANANKEISFSDKFLLYQIYKEEGTYYWNGGPQELLWKLNNFYFKNFNARNNKIKN